MFGVCRMVKVSEDAMTSEEFRVLAERISKYVNLRGCRTGECINRRIRSLNSKKLNILVEHDFGFRLIIEAWINPHPVYKEMLGMSNKEYEDLVREKEEADKVVGEIIEYERYLRSKKRDKKRY